MTLYADSASSDAGDEPESLSLVQSKTAIEHREQAVKKSQAAAKEKKRVQNRERDRKLKERAEATRRNGKRRPGEPVGSTRARAAEDEDVKDNGREDASEDQNISLGGGEDESQKLTGPLFPKPNPNHLPDHLFTSVFNAQTQRESTETLPRARKKPTVTQNSKRGHMPRKHTSKDILIG
jgi:hypothetical protein